MAGKPPGWTGTLIAVDWQGVSAIDSLRVGGLVGWFLSQRMHENCYPQPSPKISMTGWKIVPFLIGDVSSNGLFSIVMLVFGWLYLPTKLPENKPSM